MIKFILVILFFIITGCSSVQKHYAEKHYQTILCNDLQGKMEYVLKDKTRVDCLTEKYAIEVDFAKKWAESIGQSLYYAEQTGRKPAIGLIVGKKDKRFVKRITTLTKKYKIKLFILEK